MKMTAGLSILAAGALMFLFSASQASAQARTRPRATAPGAGAVKQAAGKEGAVILKMEATGQNALARTPKFQNNAAEPPAQARKWARISVNYKTGVEWTDELEFRYLVLVKHPKTGAFTTFSATVNYVDIPKGKQHISTVFLRPNTLGRYGAVEWAGVKIYLRGKDAPVAVAQMPKNELRPWTIEYKIKENVLLNRDQTPFALVAIDNYETIKPK